MKLSNLTRIAIPSLILPFFFVFCDNSSTDNPKDPSNLVVTVVSVDNNTWQVVIQATAENTVEYQLLIGDAETPVQTNTTGYFEYTFENGDGVYEVTVKAYGESGKYIKSVKTISINAVPDAPVPLDSGYFSATSYDGYNLVWQDEFNGTSVDASNWTFETGGEWYNNELQYYRTENATVADDVLTIEARKENYGGHNYTSARMITQNKKMFKYGRIDIRAVLPEGQGLWPALWTLGKNMGSVGWPACGEIDIMEMIGGSGRERTVYSTLHWDDNGQADYGLSYTATGKNFHEKYHVFSMDWNETTIRSYVDDQLFYTIDISSAAMSEFRQEHFFIFNLAVGGVWPGNPDNTTVFPQQLKVDYIRVFQKQ
jgi:beta-glucanase (GH16 family)